MADEDLRERLARALAEPMAEVCFLPENEGDPLHEDHRREMYEYADAALSVLGPELKFLRSQNDDLRGVFKTARAQKQEIERLTRELDEARLRMENAAANAAMLFKSAQEKGQRIDSLEADLAALRASAVVPPEDWRDQVAVAVTSTYRRAESVWKLIELVESWRPSPVDGEPGWLNAGGIDQRLKATGDRKPLAPMDAADVVEPDDGECDAPCGEFVDGSMANCVGPRGHRVEGSGVGRWHSPLYSDFPAPVSPSGRDVKEPASSLQSGGEIESRPESGGDTFRAGGEDLNGDPDCVTDGQRVTWWRRPSGAYGRGSATHPSATVPSLAELDRIFGPLTEVEVSAPVSPEGSETQCTCELVDDGFSTMHTDDCNSVRRAPVADRADVRRDMVRLTPAMKRHLRELVDAPYWHPETSGEWACARAMANRGLLGHDPSRGVQPYQLTDFGREIAAGLTATDPAASGHTEED